MCIECVPTAMYLAPSRCSLSARGTCCKDAGRSRPIARMSSAPTAEFRVSFQASTHVNSLRMAVKNFPIGSRSQEGTSCLSAPKRTWHGSCCCIRASAIFSRFVQWGVIVCIPVMAASSKPLRSIATPSFFPALFQTLKMDRKLTRLERRATCMINSNAARRGTKQKARKRPQHDLIWGRSLQRHRPP